MKLYAPSIEVDDNQTVSLKDYRELQKRMQQLEIENEILKNYSHIRQKTIGEIVFFMTKYQDHYPVKIMCNLLGINHSAYYKCLNHKTSNRDVENQKLDEGVLAIYYNT